MNHDSMHAKEPALKSGSLTALATLILDLIVGFGVPLDDHLRTLVIGILSLLAPLVHMLIVRSGVFSPATMATVRGDLEAVIESLSGSQPDGAAPAAPASPAPAGDVPLVFTGDEPEPGG
jgi:hypothetical protein